MLHIPGFSNYVYFEHFVLLQSIQVHVLEKLKKNYYLIYYLKDDIGLRAGNRLSKRHVYYGNYKMKVFGYKYLSIFLK